MCRLKKHSNPMSDNGTKLGEIKSKQANYEAISGANTLILFQAFMGTPWCCNTKCDGVCSYFKSGM